MLQETDQTTDFAYDVPSDPAGIAARVAIFGDHGRVRDEIAQDLGGAGFRTVDGGELANLIEGPITLLGDVVMVDCPMVDAVTLAALSRLDMRVTRSGARLIVCTSMDALDDVFAALDQSDPQILVQPSRADRLVCVGQILADIGSARVREMTREDRLNLLHLSRQVEAIAHKLEGLSGPEGSADFADGSAGRENVRSVTSGSDRARKATELGGSDAAPPDPRVVRQLIAARQLRAQFFDGELFSDPAWDMLLDLTAAHGEGQRVSVTSLCIAACVPATTALRWLKQMVESGVFIRGADPEDKRRAFIALSDDSLQAMARYFAEVETPLAKAA